MLKREFVLPIECCPICGAKGSFQMRGRTENIPYFGETLETVILCSRCKFRHADVAHTGESPPMRYSFSISSEDDMKVRVVRSSTGTVKVPELGVTVRPGPASEGYVSNIEGVLDRIEDAVRLAIASCDDAKRRRGEAKLKRISDIRSGRAKAKLIVMDPFGHSAVADRRAKKKRLTKKESERLAAGL